MGWQQEAKELREELTKTRIKVAEVGRDVTNYAKATTEKFRGTDRWLFWLVTFILVQATGIAAWLVRIEWRGGVE